mmetsp:Transcript_31685/g.97933  ORF Transcript_31685/g.97933 Transcript_31685/m.97933 type:complete len:210 (-) Transcript_31685:378-1007(-)
MWPSAALPMALPAAISARSASPALKCAKPKSRTRRFDSVPLPPPGGPRISALNAAMAMALRLQTPLPSGLALAPGACRSCPHGARRKVTVAATLREAQIAAVLGSKAVIRGISSGADARRRSSPRSSERACAKDDRRTVRGAALGTLGEQMRTRSQARVFARLEALPLPRGRRSCCFLRPSMATAFMSRSKSQKPWKSCARCHLSHRAP